MIIINIHERNTKTAYGLVETDFEKVHKREHISVCADFCKDPEGFWGSVYEGETPQEEIAFIKFLELR